MSAASSAAVVAWGQLRRPCMRGRTGVRALKREGDGATPRGTFTPVYVLYRADRRRRPRTVLPVRALLPDDGWNDAAMDRNYNRPIAHPYPASAERLWRTDRLYDLIVVLSHNQRPRVAGAGSAVFVHVTSEDQRPTAGCIALAPRDLDVLVQHLTPSTRLVFTT
ncbi:MAG: L,D-transpeptidase family protein [Pseudomonadota bacterium]